MSRRPVITGCCRRAAVLLGLLATLVCGAAAEAGERPRAGLLWNRTGLPAVFPLQVKSPEGADYYLVLTSSGSGQEALAAYIRGGAFFKVLVPPGRYALRFASGTDWRGEEQLFGPDTVVFALPEDLEFAIRGAGIKAGHLVVLTRDAPGAGLRAEVTGQFVCQIASLDGPDRAQLLAELPRWYRLGGDPRERDVLHLRWRLGVTGAEPGTPDSIWQRSLFVLGNPNFPRRPQQLISPPLRRLQRGGRSYSVRSLYCS